MGQEIHRERLIHGTNLIGRTVIVDIVHDDFAAAMLEKYLQLNHPKAKIVAMDGYYDYQNDLTKMKIWFASKSEAIAFHLKYHT